MKTSFLTITVLSAFWKSASLGQDLHSTVTNLWWNGPKSNVLAIADARLAVNTNDIAGIVLKMEGEFSFGDGTAISNAVRRFLSVGSGIFTPAFRVRYPLEAFNACVLLDGMPSFTAAEWMQEHEYGAALHKPMMFGDVWDSLWEDAWLDSVSPSNILDEQRILDRTPIQWGDPDIQMGKMLVAYMVHESGKTAGEESEVWSFFRSHSDADLLSEAERRRIDDPNDLVGAAFELFVRFRGCDPSVLSNAVDRIAVLSNAVDHVLAIGALETRSPFADHWPWMSVYLDNVRIWTSGTNAVPFEEAIHHADLHPTP